MGKMEELEKAMTLLDKMRGVIGDGSYKAKVASVLDAFPVFSTYDVCVDIIDVDADDHDGQPDLPPVNTVLKTPSTRQSATPASILVTAGSDCIVDEEDDGEDDEWAASVKCHMGKRRRLCEDDDQDVIQSS